MSAQLAELYARTALEAGFEGSGEKLNNIARALIELAKAVAEIQVDLQQLKPA